MFRLFGILKQKLRMTILVNTGSHITSVGVMSPVEIREREPQTPNPVESEQAVPMVTNLCPGEQGSLLLNL
jgi:hypothetical protein